MNNETSKKLQPSEDYNDDDIINSVKTSFFENHFLLITIIIALFLSLISAAIVRFSMTGITEDRAAELAFFALISTFLFVLVFTWPRWIWRKVDKLVSKAVDSLGDLEGNSDDHFRNGIQVVFDENVSASIFEYEKYLKNEYMLDMKKHHFSWLLLAISGLLTIVLAFMVVFSFDKGADWVAGAAAALPALVTGVLLKIWLETRENLRKTRERTDKVYRQKIRILFLASRLNKSSDLTIDQAIKENTNLLQYIRLEAEDD